MSAVILFEGATDEPILERLLEDAGLDIAARINGRGKATIDRQLKRYNDAAKRQPFVVVRDLDVDAACAPAYLETTKMTPSRWMCFRIAVRELEAWLLADAEAVARFLRVKPGLVPLDPDAELDPTQTIVQLARASVKSAIRDAIVPEQGAGTTVGPGYEATIIDFARNHWKLNRAARRSRSLRGARAAIRDLAGRWNAHSAGS
jgi:hypothetical protein